MMYEEYDLTEEVGRTNYKLKDKKMNSLLKFLDGKKVIIGGIITTTASFLVLKGLIFADTAVYIDTLVTIIFGTAAVITTKMREEL